MPDPGEFVGGGAGASTVSPGMAPGDPGANQAYTSGPPGGAMDPGTGYRQPGAPAGQPGITQDSDDDEDNVAQGMPPMPQGAPPPPPAMPPAPGGPDDAGGSIAVGPVGPGGPGPAVIQPPTPAPRLPPVGVGPGPGPGSTDDADPGDQVADAQPGDPTAAVGDAEIDATLTGYGQWIETDDYGEVWRPDATVVGVDFTPYESGGSWQDTDAGWAFSCDYAWGWLPFHYGRWAWFHDYWGWVPGHRWGAAWVDWRHGGDVVGWRPRPPGKGYHHGNYHYGAGTEVVRDHRHPEQHDASWRFAATRDFGRPHIRSHLYGNLAEGLRVTSRVAAPPLHARITAHAGDLMRGRFATSGRTAPSGRWSGGGVVRDHRDQAYPGVGHAIRPSGGDAPAARGYPPSAPPVRPSGPNGATGAASGGTYAPGRSYNPPARAYNPPSRGYSPPARSSSPPPSPAWHGGDSPHFGGGGSPPPPPTSSGSSSGHSSSGSSSSSGHSSSGSSSSTSSSSSSSGHSGHH